MTRRKKMPKYRKPLYVYAWEEHPFMPRCCWLCRNFDPETAWCSKYRMEVPEDFVSKEDACEAWIDKDGVPF